jgi:hypothetical protein
MNDEHFDKKLLTLLILIFIAVAVMCPSSVGSFAIRSIDTLLGALLGIITGKYMALRTQTQTSGTDQYSA